MSLKRMMRLIKRLYGKDICYVFIPIDSILFNGYKSVECSIGSLYRHINSNLIIFDSNEADLLYGVIYSCLGKLKNSKVFYNVKIKPLRGKSLTVAFIYGKDGFIIVTPRGIHRYSDVKELLSKSVELISMSMEFDYSYVDEVRLYIPLNSSAIRIRYSCNFTDKVFYLILLNSLLLALYVEQIMCTT